MKKLFTLILIIFFLGSLAIAEEPILEVIEESPIEETYIEIEEPEVPLGIFEEEPELIEEFTGSVSISCNNRGTIYYGDEITLTAEVENANAPYTISWEVNQQNGEGWRRIENENDQTYNFICSQENVNYEYRAVLHIDV